MRYPATQGQRDSNEADIIKALEAVGATVEQLPTGKGVPDLLVGIKHFGIDGQRSGRPVNYLIEVKQQPEKGKVFKSQVQLNDKQKEWHSTWKGQKAVVHTIEEALAVIDVY